MDFYIPQNIICILEKLETAGYEAYLVGGCVRDSILGKEPKDYDITTSASPTQIKKCFEGYTVIETGIKYGTVVVVSDGENIEITTFRVDGEYTDFRRPEEVTFSDKLYDDLSRRDFTINAMAYSIRTGIIDNFGGQKDLFKRRIVCVGEPAVRFNEDALRILRALRLASVLDFQIESITSIAIHELKRLLSRVSAERVAAELEKLICGNAAAYILTEYSDVIAQIIPEIKPCINFDQHNKFHVYDVWTHTANAIGNAKNERDVRLALLLHDISKPQCFKQDDEGNGHFPNHEKISADMAVDILKKLKFSNHTIDTVTDLIKYHYVTPIDDSKVVKKLLSVLGAEKYFMLMEVMKGDNRAKHSLCFERVQVVEAMAERARKIIESSECYSVSMLNIKGDEIAALGVSGKEIGDMLSMLLTKVINENVANTHDELLLCVKNKIDEK